MVDWLSEFLGTYSPPTFSETVGEITNEVIPSGLAGVDWHYVLSGLLLIVVVYCFFKVLGGVLCRLF